MDFITFRFLISGSCFNHPAYTLAHAHVMSSTEVQKVLSLTSNPENKRTELF